MVFFISINWSGISQIFSSVLAPFNGIFYIAFVARNTVQFLKPGKRLNLFFKTLKVLFKKKFLGLPWWRSG